MLTRLVVLSEPLQRTARKDSCMASSEVLSSYVAHPKEFSDLIRSMLQASTAHPIALDMVAWPSLRDRLVHQHATLFSDSRLCSAYANCLRFDWPFSFEDTFYYNEAIQGWCPSPVFEKFHGDVSRWTVSEAFWEGFEELRGDIEGYKIA